MSNKADHGQEVTRLLDSFKIESVLHEIASSAEEEIRRGPVRFAQFKEAFDARFTDPEERAGAQALVWALLGASLALLYSGQTVSVFTDLYGFLERYTCRDLAAILGKNAAAAAAIETLIGRKVLSELADTLEELEIWDKEDVSFARKLGDIRNGIAHKNARLLSNRIGHGEELHMNDAVILTYQVDCIPYIIRTVELLLKLTRVTGRRFEHWREPSCE